MYISPFAKHQAEIWPGFWIEFIRGKFVHLKYLTSFNFEQLILLGEMSVIFSTSVGGRPQWCCRPQLSGKPWADYTRVSFKILLFFMTECSGLFSVYPLGSLHPPLTTYSSSREFFDLWMKSLKSSWDLHIHGCIALFSSHTAWDRISQQSCIVCARLWWCHSDRIVKI